MKFQYSLFPFLLTLLTPVFGFEINTHQAITSCALSSKCLKIEDQQGSQNLNYFALTMKLNNIDYSDNIFEKYGSDSYLKYTRENEGLGHSEGKTKKKLIGFTEGETYLKGAKNKEGEVTNFIDYSDTSYISLIEAGSILEDAMFHNVTPRYGLEAADGRFNNHFYWAQSSYPVGKPYPPLGYRPFFWLTDEVVWTNSFRLSDKASLASNPWDAWPSNRTDAISWALDKDVDLGNDRVNDYNLHKAFEYYKKSFGGASFDSEGQRELMTKDVRKKYQAKMFVALGHVIHLLEDLHSPAHVRNGAHAGGDYLEIFGRHNGGFVLRDGKFPPTNDYEITRAIEGIDVDQEILRNNGYSSYQSFFEREAIWVSQNFFSEAHSFIASLGEIHIYSDTVDPGVNLGRDTCGSRNTTIFDNLRNPTPHNVQTTRAPATEGFNFIRSNGNASVVKGDLSDKTDIAYEQTGSFLIPSALKCKTMAAPILEGLRHHSYNSFDKNALLDTAKHVIPRAVASVQAFANFFFRGRMEASLSFDNQYLIVENVSDYGLVAHPRLTTFKADVDATFSLYYVNDAGVSELLKNDFNFEKDLKARPSDFVEPDENKTAFYIGDLLKDKGIEIKVGDTGENNRLILVFDGNIGDEDLMLADDYGIGAKGLSSSYVTKSMVKKTGVAGWYEKGATNYYISEPRLIEGEPGSEVLDTVLDVTTGLMWQDDADVGTVRKSWIAHNPNLNYDYSDTSGDTAATYCSQLSLGGYNDWRLPDIKELSSIIVYDRRPQLDNRYFKYPIVSSSLPYWSSSSTPVLYPNGYDETYAYLVAFNVGRIATRQKVSRNNTPDGFYELGVRCVRNQGNTNPIIDIAAYSVTQNMVVDGKTNLQWELNNPKIDLTWADATTYCQNLDLNDKGWRVPNINELTSITDYSKHGPSISESFNDVFTNYTDNFEKPYQNGFDSTYGIDFWSSTVLSSKAYIDKHMGPLSYSAVQDSFSLQIDANAGTELRDTSTEVQNVRCVR